MNVLLRVVSAKKSYGPIEALRGASLELCEGQVHAIVGENGAGKSTLLSIAAGLVVADAGHVEIDGRVLSPCTPHAAIARGVGMVQQHFRLIDALTVVENVMLGVEPTRGALGSLDEGAARAKLKRVLDDLGATLPMSATVSQLGVGERQRLEIARVLYRDARILILDEPTAVLTPQEASALFRTLRRLASGGRAVAVVTHKLDEVLEFADVATVLRRGRVVVTRPVAGEDRATLTRSLTQDIMGDAVPRPAALREPRDEKVEPLLKIEGLKTDGKLRGVRLEVRPGEIVGIAGVEGNGQRELVDVLAGLSEASSGSVRARAPVWVVHEDRHERGLVLGASIADNAVLGELSRFARGLIDVSALREEAQRRVDSGGVSPPEIDLPADALSGGNQQKLVVARAIARGGEKRILVLAQPTRGVDMGAAQAIHERIAGAAREGAAVLVVSADLDELRALSDRILVMSRGRIVGDARRGAGGAWDDAASNEKLGERMLAAELA